MSGAKMISLSLLLSGLLPFDKIFFHTILVHCNPALKRSLFCLGKVTRLKFEDRQGITFVCLLNERKSP